MASRLQPLGASFNHQVPRDGELDVLWEFLLWMLVICADCGTEVRYYGRQSKSASAIQGEHRRIYMRVNGKWFEAIPFGYALQHFQFRLLDLFGMARPRQRFPKRPFKRDTELRFTFERLFDFEARGLRLGGICRVASLPGRLKIRFMLSPQSEFSAEAKRFLAEVLPRLLDHMVM